MRISSEGTSKLSSLLVDLKNGSLKVITENTPWPERTPRIASINSFGYGGANAHAILEAADSFLSSHACHLGQGRANFPNSVLSKGDNERRHIISASQSPKDTGAPNAAPLTREQQGRETFLLVFSAHNNPTLKANMRAIVEVSGQYDLIDLAHTLGMRRSQHSERSFAVANRHSIKNILTIAEASTGRVKGMQSPKIGFILNGDYSPNEPLFKAETRDSRSGYSMASNGSCSHAQISEFPP